MAATTNGYTILGGNGSLETMRDTNGNPIAVATARTDELIMIEYTDASP
jgi:hypothetical protein